MLYLCAWEFFSSLVSRKLLIWWKIGWGHTYRKRRGGVEGGRQGREGGCSQRGRQQNFGFFCPGWSYLRNSRPLRKVTPTSISMRRGRPPSWTVFPSNSKSTEKLKADFKNNYEIVLNFSWIVYFRSRCQRFEVSLICFAKDRAQVLSTRPTFLSFVLLRNMKSQLQEVYYDCGYDEKGRQKHLLTSNKSIDKSKSDFAKKYRSIEI